MRGLQRRCSTNPPIWGITPACAGTTSINSDHRADVGDHPRMCGDYGRDGMRSGKVVGSPPHVRGLLRQRPHIIKHGRITPACAGTTSSIRLTPYPVRDHPRMCGDYNQRGRHIRMPEGSPPHVRGLLASSNIFDRALRITPACAGTTYQKCRCGVEV